MVVIFFAVDTSASLDRKLFGGKGQCVQLFWKKIWKTTWSFGIFPLLARRSNQKNQNQKQEFFLLTWSAKNVFEHTKFWSCERIFERAKIFSWKNKCIFEYFSKSMSCGLMRIMIIAPKFFKKQIINFLLIDQFSHQQHPSCYININFTFNNCCHIHYMRWSCCQLTIFFFFGQFRDMIKYLTSSMQAKFENLVTLFEHQAAKKIKKILNFQISAEKRRPASKKWLARQLVFRFWSTFRHFGTPFGDKWIWIWI